jgi:nitrite reductase (NADH) small subunit
METELETAVDSDASFADAVDPAPTGLENWVLVCPVDDLTEGTGTCARLGGRQVAVFRLPGGEVRAVQNICPHKAAPVIFQGLVGDKAGEAKVSCPLHKRSYSLEDGRNLTGEGGTLKVFEAQVRDGRIWIRGA